MDSAVIVATAIICCIATSTVQLVEASDPLSSPQFTASPAAVVVAAGETARLACGATGEPPPSVAWYREGGGEVGNGGRFTVNTDTGELTVAAVELSDGGGYYCVASNAVGSVRSLIAPLQLAVFSTEGLPELGTNLERKFVSERQNLTLPCTVPTSLPPASIQWEFNQAILDEPALNSGQTGITLSGELVISSINVATDSGRFYCFVSNDVIDNSRTYTTGYLVIGGGTVQPLSIPTSFVTTPTSQSVVIGDTVEFECFTTGTPVAEISWTKDGSPLTSSLGHISLSQAQRLVAISSVTEVDAGSYVCTATVPSTGSSIVSPSATLTITVPPTITASFPALAANVTQEVILSCEVVASDDGSNIQWVWRVNSSEVVTSGNVLYDRSGLVSRLQIVSVMEEHAGVYQCVASLVVAGGDQRQAAANERLSVILTPPTILTQPTSDLLVFVGVAVSLPCTAAGFPPPSFSWVKGEGTPVDLRDSRISIPEEGTGDGTLTISPAAVPDSSLYQCTATNTAGSDSTSASQLRVLERSVVKRRPEELAAASPSGVFTADHGNTVSIPCNVSRSQDGTTVVYQWYRDGERVATVAGASTGALVLGDVDQEHRGRYECVVEISVAGVGGQPLEEIIGAVTIGVGEPPTAPSAPAAPFVTMVTSHTLILGWTPPTFRGNLPLTGYRVEVLLLGNQICPQLEPEWKLQQTVDDPSAVHTTVTGLVPFQQYHVRIRATNSAYQSSPSTVVDSVSTDPYVPTGPPSNVQVTSGSLHVSWDHPEDCLTYGGPLTDYTVSYRISSESTFVERRVGSNKTSLTLSSLRSQTSYTVVISAHTNEGAGPNSDPVEATTNECSAPSPPTDLRVESYNSTAALLKWATPTDPNDLYIVTWCHGNRDMRNVVLIGANSTFVTGLKEGEVCEVVIQVNNQCGTGAPTNITVNLLETGGGLTVSILERPWFIPVVTVLATLLVFGAPTVVLFLICFRFRRQEGKIYTATSRRSASSLSGASTAFTEYHQKHGEIAKATRLTVHSDPPPQRRSTDYADLTSYNSHVSSGSPSISSYQRQTTTETNGGPPSHHHGQQSPAHPTADGITHHLTSQLGNGHQILEREGVRFGHHRGISSQDESTDSWSASESLGYRGHMTGHVTDGGGVNNEWRPSNQLSPLHEHQVMESHDRRQNWREIPGESSVAAGNHRHSSQPLLSRHGNSPSPPPLPTSLPPPLSLPPQHTCSMDHILDPRVSHSETQFQNPHSGTGIQNGTSLTVVRSPSPEYAEPKQVVRAHREREKPSQPKLLALPPKSKSRQGSKVKPLTSAPNLLSGQLPRVAEEGPRPVVAPKPPHHHLSEKLFQRSTSEHTAHSHSGLERGHGEAPPLADEPQRDSELKQLLTQWKTDQERREREGEERPHPLNGYPNVVGLLDMPEGLGGEDSSGPDDSSRPSISSHTDRWTATPSPQSGPAHHHILDSETPIVKNAPPVFSKSHPQPHPPSSRQHTSRRNRAELEDIYQRDPRKPRRRKGRVPGAVWKQMPMNSRIESSSSESDDSLDSDNASLTSEYV